MSVGISSLGPGDFERGMRVELLPGSDAWRSGARSGIVVRIGLMTVDVSVADPRPGYHAVPFHLLEPAAVAS